MQNDKFLNKDKTQAILDTRPAGVPINEALSALAKQGYTIEGYNDVSLAEKAGNVVGGIAKTVASDLVVRPVSRATEAVTRTVFPDSMAAKGYESYADENKPVQTGVFGIEVPQPSGARDIVGETAQTASYLIPYGKVASGVAGATGSKLLGQLAAGTAGGYTADIGMGLQDENKTLKEAVTPGVGTAIGVGLPLTFAGSQAIGRTLQKTGQGMVGSVLPVGEQEAGIIQSYIAKKPFLERVTSVLTGTDNAPITSGTTAVNQSLFGTKKMIGVQAKRAQDTLWKKVIQPELDNAKVQIDLPEYFNSVEKKIIEETPELTRQKALLEALNSFKDDYAGMNTISLARLQKLKEGWAEFVPEKFYKGQNIAGNARQVSALLADEARDVIYKTLGNDVKQAYFDYGNLMGLAKMGQTAMTGQKLKGGTGGFVSELASRAVTPVGTVGGNVIYKIGQGLEFIGKAGAKTLDEVLGLNKNQVLNQPTKTQPNQSATKANKKVIMKDTIPQTAKAATKKVEKSIPKKLQPLAKEAKNIEPITSVNPTGGVLVDYTPQARMTAPLGENMTTLANTMKKNPDTLITVYRGAPKTQKAINPGDFISTDRNSALSYAEDGNVISKKVKLGDILDDMDEPLGGDYLYRPGAFSEIGNRVRDISKSEWYKNYLAYLKDNPTKFKNVDEWLNAMKASNKPKQQLIDLWNKASGKK